MFGSLFLLNILLFPLLCRSSEDASDVTWGHAINSRKALEDALLSNLDFLEADVSLGSTDSANGIPIMSHPPQTHSDISLEEWITTVVKENKKKGIKLDFKSTEVLEPALKILDSKRSQLTFPLWLNADILQGPFNASANHVDDETFLTLFKKDFPNLTLSVGWTTQLGSNVNRYSWKDVSQMARVIRCQNITQPITFPVRGVFVKESVPQFLWLSSAIPMSTFTVWSAIGDPLQVSDLLELRKALPVSQVYYDLPADQNKEFLKLKNTVTSPKDGNSGKNLRVKTLRDSSFTCNTETILGANSIVYGGAGPVAIFHPGVLKKGVDISGRLYSCDTESKCKSGSNSNMIIKVANSPDFWNSNTWTSQRGELLTIVTSTPIEGTVCSVSFHISFKNVAEKRQNANITQISTKNTGNCLDRVIHPKRYEIYGDMYVGVIIEGRRRITLEDFTVTTTGGGASLTSISYVLLSILCAISSCRSL